MNKYLTNKINKTKVKLNINWDASTVLFFTSGRALRITHPQIHVHHPLDHYTVFIQHITCEWEDIFLLWEEYRPSLGYLFVWYVNIGSCGRLKIRCPDGRCLTQREMCDGVAQCSDGRDEPQTCGTRSWFIYRAISKTFDNLLIDLNFMFILRIYIRS